MKFKIKEARERIGLSQKELAESLGIKPTTFNGYEKGTHDPKSEILKQIAIKCETSVDFLLGLSEQDNNSSKKNSNIDFNKQLLIDNYERLNDLGRSKLIDYSDVLVGNNQFARIDDKIEKRA